MTHAREANMSNARRWQAFGAATAVTVVLTAATAWACIAGPTLNVNPAQAKPGQEVTLTGFSYKGDVPIVVRFNSLDGPVLGTFKADGGRFGDDENLNATVRIPADAKPGNYVLIATQSDSDGSLSQVPVRALVTVTSDGGPPVLGAELGQAEFGRPVGPARSESSVGIGPLLLMGMGAAGVAMFAAGMAVLLPSRRRTVPEMAPTSR